MGDYAVRARGNVQCKFRVGECWGAGGVGGDERLFRWDCCDKVVCVHRVSRGRGEGVNRGKGRMNDGCSDCERTRSRAYDGEIVVGVKVEGAECTVDVHVGERGIV